MASYGKNHHIFAIGIFDSWQSWHLRGMFSFIPYMCTTEASVWEKKSTFVPLLHPCRARHENNDNLFVILNHFMSPFPFSYTDISASNWVMCKNTLPHRGSDGYFIETVVGLFAYRLKNTAENSEAQQIGLWTTVRYCAEVMVLFSVEIV